MDLIQGKKGSLIYCPNARFNSSLSAFAKIIGIRNLVSFASFRCLAEGWTAGGRTVRPRRVRQAMCASERIVLPDSRIILPCVSPNKEKRNELGNDSFDRAGTGAVRCDSDLAPQQAMGLLSQRRHRIGVVDTRDIASTGQDIVCRSGLATGGASCTRAFWFPPMVRNSPMRL
jgi:hypothetical protein